MLPYLVRMSQPARRGNSAEVALEYDAERQVSVVAHDADRTPAVLRRDIPALGTKKSDHEKGEDQKDRW